MRKKNDISNRLMIPILQVGAKAASLRLVFDTGSQGITLDAKKIIPAEMITPNGIMMNGQDSVKINNITITNIKQQASYTGGTKEITRIFDGQIAYETIILGDEKNQFVTRKMPFLLIYKGINKATQLPVPIDPVCDGICGVNSSFSSNNDEALRKSELKSPFDYMNYANNVCLGIELKPINPPGNTSVVNLTFFNDHHYLLDYRNHYIGFY